MNINEYLSDTEPAVRLLFKGLNDYDSQLNNNREIQDYKKYFALEFSRATLAGSILQIAYVAIKKFSSIKEINPQYRSFGVKDSHKKFCIGREVDGIPIGLLIYAGRTQYIHWESLENETVNKIFQHLYEIHAHDNSFDMIYDLNYPEPRPVSHYFIRLELQWKTTDDYLNDMNNIFSL